MQEKIKCAIYARDSTDQQGDTIENQISQGKEYISRLGDQYDAEDVAIFIDHAVSGYYTSVFERQAMKDAVAGAKRGDFKLILFKEVSRVGRDKQENPAIVGIFEQYGVRVIAINDNYDSLNKDNVTFGILSVLAEQESIKISSRVSSAKKQKARRGLWNTDAPIGYRLNSETKKLEIDPDSKEIVESIFHMYVHRGIGSFLIAQHLNRNGKKTRDGNPFSRESVKRILRNQAYIGNTVYGKKRNELRREYDDSGKMTKRKVQVKIDPKDWTIVEGTHEPIIDKETFYAAQRILAGRGHHRTPRRAYHPLTGILFCAKCGQGMVCQKRSFQSKQYRYYICKTYHKYGRNACPQANVNADELEMKVISVVRGRLSALSTSNIIASADRSVDLSRLENERKTKQKQREKLQKDQIDIFGQRDLFDDQTYQGMMVSLKKQIQTIDEEIAILDGQIKAIREESSQTANVVNIIEDFLSLDVNDTERLRTILHELIEKITLADNHIDIRYRYSIM
jgi:DNA invertase Pin-like site-specific DNA recombinase/archaellum component FlaC